jgi:hypothetical protein
MTASGPFFPPTPDDDRAARATREQQLRRAREVLSDAGWLFDDFVNAEMRKVLVSKPDEREAREEAYRRARVATEIKAGLESLIENYEADAALVTKRLERLQERRDRQHVLRSTEGKEGRDGRRD